MESRELMQLLEGRREEILAMLGPKKGLKISDGLKEDNDEREARILVNELASFQVREISRSLTLVEEAIIRTSRGEGGRCIATDKNGSVCDEMISDARLRAKPEAPFCIKCAELADQRKNPGLGRVKGSISKERR